MGAGLPGERVGCPPLRQLHRKGGERRKKGHGSEVLRTGRLELADRDRRDRGHNSLTALAFDTAVVTRGCGRFLRMNCSAALRLLRFSRFLGRFAAAACLLRRSTATLAARSAGAAGAATAAACVLRGMAGAKGFDASVGTDAVYARDAGKQGGGCRRPNESNPGYPSEYAHSAHSLCLLSPPGSALTSPISPRRQLSNWHGRNALLNPRKRPSRSVSDHYRLATLVFLGSSTDRPETARVQPALTSSR